jgi:spore coat polysaccharide biosynthesis protein SpsF
VKTGVLVQARVSSTRFPGKVLADLEGKPVVLRVMERVRRIRADFAAVVTSEDASDDALCGVLRGAGIEVFRGALEDVLGRYHKAAVRWGLDVVARVTADSPLIDRRLVDRALERLVREGRDAGFVAPATVPDGFRFNVLTLKALRTADERAELASEREHVVPYLWNHPDEFSVFYEEGAGSPSDPHFSVDYPEDLALVREVWKRLYPGNPDFSMEDVLRLLAREPELAALNRGVARSGGYPDALKHDRAMKRGG